jgi:hypothetical protein
VLDRDCGACHQGYGEAREDLNLTLRPGYGQMKEPYLTLVGPAIWIEPHIADLEVPREDEPAPT